MSVKTFIPTNYTWSNSCGTLTNLTELLENIRDILPRRIVCLDGLQSGKKIVTAGYVLGTVPEVVKRVQFLSLAGNSGNNSILTFERSFLQVISDFKR